jgi:holo-[acyl-carrier protein] synthase
MPERIGIDLVSVEAVSAALEAHADRYLDRVYTAAEVDDCRTPAGIDPQRLAARFAAKEATIKALAPGGEAIPWNSISVRRAASGAPALELTGAAAEQADRQGLDEFAVSLTHEEGLAAAVVIAGSAAR